ncbi:hypothetical protein RJ639_002565 [Escallonia herrerae]|uniref:RING-type domain-containing protein n=1 Tax=Escallonia herrerae TaxID=1293975 RepID=A0AA89BNM1_9ASTE|nr:hypothetical protein RJ639_002565 [Escallonia herrerae]
MMMGYYQQLARSPSCQDSLKVLEADVQQANMLAASVLRSNGGAFLQMKLLISHVHQVCQDKKPTFPSHGRKATIREFYAVILPTLQRLHENLSVLDVNQDEGQSLEMIMRKKSAKKKKHPDIDLEREDECGICLEPCTKMVLPNCCHAMCINCYRDWYVDASPFFLVLLSPDSLVNILFLVRVLLFYGRYRNMRSESCPFCRGSLKRVDSGDLWVLTCNGDVVDQETASKEEMLRFYLYIKSLPKAIPDALFFMYYEYLI